MLSLSSVLAALIGAQSGRGQLAGTVKDASGAALPGVTITLSGTERRTAVTNDRGEFTFTNLLPGTYEIRAELPGFTTVVAKATVSDGKTARVALSMSVGSVAETVTVTGETPAAGTQARRGQSAARTDWQALAGGRARHG